MIYSGWVNRYQNSDSFKILKKIHTYRVKKRKQIRYVVLFWKWGRRQSHKKGIKGGEWVSFLITSISLLNSLFSFPKLLHNYYMLPKKRGGGGGGDSMTFQNILCTCKFKKNVCWEKGGSPLPHLCYVSAKSEMLDTFESVSSLYIIHLSKNWALHNVSFS